MSKESRSSGGCWSCKLRRKKCSQEKPACLSCTLHAIPCLGYEQNPEWADRGEKQKAKTEELRILIREFTSRKRQSRKEQLYTVSQPTVILDVELLPVRLDNTAVAENHSALEFDNGSLTHISQPAAQPATVETDETVESTSRENPTVGFLEYDSQADLLMHYLDVVFPGQFPFYKPAPSDGGRGWLLLIILRTKPLYHAALSMAAHHQQIQNRDVFVPRDIEKCAAATLQMHHYLAINELRYHLDEFSREHRAQSLEGHIEMLACMVFLIMLEVFLGDTQSWHIHLSAAKALLPGYQNGCLAEFRSSAGPSPTHVKAHIFFTGVICWIDILSCATSGTRSMAPRHCLDNSIGYIDLFMMTGCDNSVVLMLLDATDLKEWKAAAQEAGTFSVPDFLDRATTIENSLMGILEECDNQDDRLTPTGSSAWYDQTTPPIASVIPDKVKRPWAATTHVFASATLVYLCVTIYGPFPDHPKVHSSVSKVLAALEKVQDRSALGLLAWPLCIAGCMSDGWQMDHFRKLSVDMERVSDLKSGNLKRSFAIVEECWRLRQTPSGYPDWQHAIESLKMKILLI